MFFLLFKSSSEQDFLPNITDLCISNLVSVAATTPPWPRSQGDHADDFFEAWSTFKSREHRSHWNRPSKTQRFGMTWCVPISHGIRKSRWLSLYQTWLARQASPANLGEAGVGISEKSMVLMNQCLFAYVFSLDVVCLWQSYGSDPYIKQRLVKWLGHQWLGFQAPLTVHFRSRSFNAVDIYIYIIYIIYILYI